MPANLDGIIWLALSLGLLLFLQRNLHKELQILLFLLTRRVDMALRLFSVIFFPGVLLHEGSHFLMAKLAGVPTGRFSIFPRTAKNGKLQLGYVLNGLVSGCVDRSGAASLWWAACGLCWGDQVKFAFFSTRIKSQQTRGFFYKCEKPGLTTRFLAVVLLSTCGQQHNAPVRIRSTSLVAIRIDACDRYWR